MPKVHWVHGRQAVIKHVLRTYLLSSARHNKHNYAAKQHALCGGQILFLHLSDEPIHWLCLQYLLHISGYKML
jgi:hypothetical protein